MLKTGAVSHLEQARAKSTFRLGDYIDEGYNIWKKEAGSFIGIFLVSIVISLGLSLIPLLGALASSLFVSPCLTLGIFLATRTIDVDHHHFQFGDFFSGFDFISKVIVLNLIIFGIGFLLVLPFIIYGATSIAGLVEFDSTDPSTFPFEIFTGGLLLFLIPIIYLSLLISYTIPMLGFYNLEPWEALKQSAKFIHKHWIMFFLFVLVIGLIALLGIFALIFGVIVTASMMNPMMYASFKDVTDLDTYLNPTDEDDTVIGLGGITLDDFR